MVGTQTVTLKFSINWFVVVGLLSLALVTAFLYLADEFKPWLVFTASVLAGAGALAAAINALESRYEQLRQQRAVAALQFIHMWLNPQFYHAKKNGREVLRSIKDMKTPEEQYAYVEADKERLANLIDILNFFEALAVGIRTQIVEEDTAKQFFRSMVVEYWNGADSFIKKRRAEKMNSRLSFEMEWLHDRWKH